MPPANAAQAKATPEYAFDGSVFIGGAVVQWLRAIRTRRGTDPRRERARCRRRDVRAGLATGVYRGLEDLSAQWQVEGRFLPTVDRSRAQALMAQ